MNWVVKVKWYIFILILSYYNTSDTVNISSYFSFGLLSRFYFLPLTQSQCNNHYAFVSIFSWSLFFSFSSSCSCVNWPAQEQWHGNTHQVTYGNGGNIYTCSSSNEMQRRVIILPHCYYYWHLTNIVSCLCKMHFFRPGKHFTQLLVVFFFFAIAHYDHMSLAINVFGRIDWNDEQLNKTAWETRKHFPHQASVCVCLFVCMRLFLLALLHQITCSLLRKGDNANSEKRTIELPLFHQG